MKFLLQVLRVGHHDSLLNSTYSRHDSYANLTKTIHLVEEKVSRSMEEKKEFPKTTLSHRGLILLILASVGLLIGSFMATRCFQTCNSHRETQLTYWPIYLEEKVHLKAVGKVFDRLGYREVNGSTDSWDVQWSVENPFYHFEDKTKKVKPHQWMNHFPGTIILANKLYMAIFSQSKYIPPSFEFPTLKNEFLYYNKVHPNKYFVAKNNAQGGVKIEKRGQQDLQADHEK